MDSILSLLCASSLLAPQEASAPPVDELGTFVALLGDLDGDGARDFAAGNRYSLDERGRPTTEVWVLSGRSAEVLYRIDGPGRIGWRVETIGDADGDGVDDFIALCHRGLDATERCSVLLFSGKDGALRQRVPDLPLQRAHLPRLGVGMGAVGDVDGDGHADFLAGSSVWSGKTGERLRVLEVSGDAVIEPVGDLDGDGELDLLVQDRERVALRYGGDGRAEVGLELPASEERLRDVCVLRDLLTGRAAHVAVGLPTWRSGGVGRVAICSPADGALTGILARGGDEGMLSGSFGTQVAAVGDLDGDGVEELAVAQSGVADVLRIFTAREGKPLRTLIGTPRNCVETLAAAAFRDLDGDGVTDLLVGESANMTCAGGHGCVRIVSGRTGRDLRTLTRAELARSLSNQHAALPGEAGEKR